MFHLIKFFATFRLFSIALVGAAFLTLASPLLPHLVSESDAACVRGVRSNDVLNIRSGPGAKFRIVGFIRPRTCGVSTGQRQGRWVWVDYGRGGFVNARFLSAEDDSVGRENLRCVRGVASGDVLNIRSRPNASSSVRGYIPRNACYVEVLGRSGKWRRISYRGTRGWVNGRYLAR